jgi:hypothetical protein
MYESRGATVAVDIPSSVPSTSPCAPKSSMATTVACHSPPQLRFDSSVSGLWCRHGDCCSRRIVELLLASAEAAASCSSLLRCSQLSGGCCSLLAFAELPTRFCRNSLAPAPREGVLRAITVTDVPLPGSDLLTRFCRNSLAPAHLSDELVSISR